MVFRSKNVALTLKSVLPGPKKMSDDAAPAKRGRKANADKAEKVEKAEKAEPKKRARKVKIPHQKFLPRLNLVFSFRLTAGQSGRRRRGRGHRSAGEEGSRQAEGFNEEEKLARQAEGEIGTGYDYTQNVTNTYLCFPCRSQGETKER